GRAAGALAGGGLGGGGGKVLVLPPGGGAGPPPEEMGHLDGGLGGQGVAPGAGIHPMQGAGTAPLPEGAVGGPVTPPQPQRSLAGGDTVALGVARITPAPVGEAQLGGEANERRARRLREQRPVAGLQGDADAGEKAADALERELNPVHASRGV